MLVVREPRPADWEEDLRRGLSIIATRAEALRRFMDAYAQLARLPAPNRRKVEVGPMVRRVAGLETRVPVTVEDGKAATIDVDPDQIEQLLINLTKNGAEAAAATGGGVRLSWTLVEKPTPALEIRVDDDGPGLPPSANLFVPFFTTKPGGSGIGLVPLPPDRRGPRRYPEPREPAAGRLPRDPAAAAVSSTRRRAGEVARWQAR